MSAAVLYLMVGLPGAGKTTRARQIAVADSALRLTPDEWHLPLLGVSLTADGRRDVLEARLINVGMRTLRLGTSVILDFGLWGRDERAALRSLAAQIGVACRIVYLPVDLDVQLARIAEREANLDGDFFAMPEQAVRAWREQFHAPDAAELAGGPVPPPPTGWSDWRAWAAERWPTLDPDEY